MRKLARFAKVVVELDAPCPTCGRLEPRRVASWRLQRYMQDPPNLVTETVVCRCGEAYTITVAHYQAAFRAVFGRPSLLEPVTRPPGAIEQLLGDET